jgi:hypothetical protein
MSSHAESGLRRVFKDEFNLISAMRNGNNIDVLQFLSGVTPAPLGGHYLELSTAPVSLVAFWKMTHVIKYFTIGDRPDSGIAGTLRGVFRYRKRRAPSCCRLISASTRLSEVTGTTYSCLV